MKPAFAICQKNSIDDAIRELYRICRIGVVCGSIATDMTTEIIDSEDLFYGVETFASMQEWGDILHAKWIPIGNSRSEDPSEGLENREEGKRRCDALVPGFRDHALLLLFKAKDLRI